MVTDMPTVKKREIKKKTRKTAEEYTTFIVEVVGWELPYSFSLNHNAKHSPSPYSEHLHLHVKGVLREPKKLEGKEIELTFIGDRSIVPEINNESSEYKPNRVGTMMMRGENKQFIGSIPFDSLQLISPMLESKRLIFIALHGLSPYRGEAATTSIRFFKDYDPEEW